MTNDTQPPQPPPEEVALKLSFDKAAIGAFRTVALDVIATHPEVRSVAVILDYKGGLNSSNVVDKGLWIGEDGPVRRIDAVFGSIDNTMAILEVMMSRSAATVQGLRDEAQVLGTEIVKRKKELEQLNAATEAAKEAAAGRQPADRPGHWPDRVWQTGGYVFDNDTEQSKMLGSNSQYTTSNALTSFGYKIEPDQTATEGRWWQLSDDAPPAATDSKLPAKSASAWPDRVWLSTNGHVYDSGDHLVAKRLTPKARNDHGKALDVFGYEQEPDQESTGGGRWWRRKAKPAPADGSWPAVVWFDPTCSEIRTGPNRIEPGTLLSTSESTVSLLKRGYFPSATYDKGFGGYWQQTNAPREEQPAQG